MQNGGTTESTLKSATLATTAPVATVGASSQVPQAGSKRTKAILQRMHEAENFHHSVLMAMQALSEDDELVVWEFINPLFAASLQRDDIVLLQETQKMILGLFNQLAVTNLYISLHGMQTSVDVAETATGIALFARKLTHSGHDPFQASSLDDKGRENFLANCRRFPTIVSNNFVPVRQQHGLQEPDQHLSSHHCAVDTVVGGGVATTVAPISILSTGIDAIGSSMREIQGVISASSRETEAFPNLYRALSNCQHALTHSLSERNSQSVFNFLIALEDLIKQLEACREGREFADQHFVSGASSLQATRCLLSDPALHCLKTIALFSVTVIQMHVLSQNDLAHVAAHQITFEAREKASALPDEGSHSANVKFLLAQCRYISQQFDDINNDPGALQERSAKSGVVSVGDMSLTASALATLVPSVITGLSGAVTRELMAAQQFIRDSNSMLAEFGQVSRTGDALGRDLDDLLKVACQLADALDRAEQRGASLPSATGATRSTLYGGSAAALNTVIGMTLVAIEMRTACQKLETASLTPAQVELEHGAAHADNVAKAHKARSQQISGTTAPDDLSAEAMLPTILARIKMLDRTQKPVTEDLGDRPDLNATAAFTAGQAQHPTANLSRAHLPGLLCGALSAVAFVTGESVIATEASLRSTIKASTKLAEALKDIESISKGPDALHMGRFRTNLYSASNATRLSGGHLNDQERSSAHRAGSAFLSTAGILELTASRSFVVALCNSDLLRRALWDLSKEKDVPANVKSGVGSTDAAVQAAAPDVLSALADKIKAQLDAAVGVDGEQIPGLHPAMAAHLARLSQSQISAVLMSHGASIVPMIRAWRHTDAGSERSYEHQDVARIDSSILRELSFSLNTSLGCLLESERLALDVDQREDRLASIHQTSVSMSDRVTVASASLAAIMSEAISSATRSWTLIDKAKSEDALKLMSAAAKQEIPEESKLSRAWFWHDGRFGEAKSASLSVTATRLSLCRLGVALCRLARAMEENTEGLDPATQQNELEAFRLQVSLLQSMGQFITSGLFVTDTAVYTTGGVLVCPLLSRTSVESARDTVAQVDAKVAFGSERRAAQGTMNDPEAASSASFGLSTDAGLSIVTNGLKTVLMSALKVSLTGLMAAKITEILSLHDDPRFATQLETLHVMRPEAVDASGGLEHTRRGGHSAVALPALLSALLLAESKDDDCLGSSFGSTFAALQQVVNEKVDAMRVLHDPETATKEASKLDITEYTVVLLQSMGMTEEDAKSVASRFNRGGYAFSALHSEYGGIPTPKRWSQAGPQELQEELLSAAAKVRPEAIKDINDMVAFEQHIIRRLVDEQTTQDDMLVPTAGGLLTTLKAQLADKSLTRNALDMHHAILARVADELAQIASIRQISDPRRPPFDTHVFLTTHQMAAASAVPVATVTVTSPPTKPLPQAINDFFAPKPGGVSETISTPKGEGTSTARFVSPPPA